MSSRSAARSTSLHSIQARRPADRRGQVDRPGHAGDPRWDRSEGASCPKARDGPWLAGAHGRTRARPPGRPHITTPAVPARGHGRCRDAGAHPRHATLAPPARASAQRRHPVLPAPSGRVAEPAWARLVRGNLTSSDEGMEWRIGRDEHPCSWQLAARRPEIGPTAPLDSGECHPQLCLPAWLLGSLPVSLTWLPSVVPAGRRDRPAGVT